MYRYRRTLPPFVADRRAGPSDMTQAGAAYRVLCADGRVRIATATADADTYYTVPARVSVRGQTVAGHVFAAGATDTARARDRRGRFVAATPLYRFSPYAYRRNADALPEWPRS